ncbi:MAG: hypothetical protein AAFO62_02660 [Pseudomonadota bacterium]
MFLAFVVGLVAPAVAGTRLPAIRTGAGNAVPACTTHERLTTYLQANNPQLDPYYTSVARQYEVIGQAFGVRWDFAFFQMMVETNALAFASGRNAGPRSERRAQNNFAGLGALSPEDVGEQFPDMASGIQAHLEHVLMYAGRHIPNPVAERTRKVQAWRVLDQWREQFDRPRSWNVIGLRWSSLNAGYVDRIEQTARRFYRQYCPTTSWNEVIAQPAPLARAPTTLASAWVARSSGTSSFDQASAVGGPIQAPKPRLAARPKRPATRRALAARPRLPVKNLNGGSGPRLASLAPTVVERSRTRPALTEAPVAAPERAPRPAGPRTKAVKPAAKPRPKIKAKPAARKQPNRTVPKQQKKRASPDDAVRTLVNNRTVQLKTDMGAVIPIRFRDNGTMRGHAGNLAFFLGSARDSGKWWVKRGLLCKRWRVWLDSKTMCLKLRRKGQIVHWRSRDGRSGTAKIVR